MSPVNSLQSPDFGELSGSKKKSSPLRSSPDLTPAPACGRQALPKERGL